jgi:hypothetical protein
MPGQIERFDVAKQLMCPVLVLGGRGAGKELVATALHSASNRCVTQRSLVYDRHARFDCRHKVQIGEPDPPQHQPGCDAEHPSRAVARGCHPAANQRPEASYSDI